MTGPVLVALAFTCDAACVVATHSWPVAVSSTVVYLMLVVAWCLSIAAYRALRWPGGDDGGSPVLPDPDPPWWPEFERQFRDYTRRGPRRVARVRPRQPVA